LYINNLNSIINQILKIINEMLWKIITIIYKIIKFEIIFVKNKFFKDTINLIERHEKILFFSEHSIFYAFMFNYPIILYIIKLYFFPVMLGIILYVYLNFCYIVIILI